MQLKEFSMTTNDKKSLAALIPEIYYDLIARVIPGAVFIIAGFVILKFKYSLINEVINLKEINFGMASFILIIFLILSYSCGMFFSSISFLLLHLIYPLKIFFEWIGWKNIRKDDELIKLISSKINISGIKEKLQKNPKDFDRYIRNYIKIKDISLGSIIEKMRAEIFLFSNISLAFFILFLAIIINPYNNFKLTSFPSFTLFILSIVSGLAFINRLINYVERLRVIIYLIFNQEKM
jgi:hypothetical protein